MTMGDAEADTLRTENKLNATLSHLSLAVPPTFGAEERQRFAIVHPAPIIDVSGLSYTPLIDEILNPNPPPPYFILNCQGDVNNMSAPPPPPSHITVKRFG